MQRKKQARQAAGPRPNMARVAPRTAATTRQDRHCHRCVYAAYSPGRCLLAMAAGWPGMLTCVNHAEAPGRLMDVPHNGTCRNFRPRRDPPVRADPPTPPNDEVRYIALTRGTFAVVDAADYERLNRYRWNAFGSGRQFYARRSVPGGTVLMHRQIMRPPDGMVVDHIDGNGLNNRAYTNIAYLIRYYQIVIYARR